MALVKQLERKGSHTLVTFTIGDQKPVTSSPIFVLGDFNNWQTNDTAFQMEKEGGSYVKSLKLENGKRYEFRYLSESSGWFNDEAADDYAPSPFAGIENGVIDLSTVPKKKKAVKKTKKNDLKKIEGIGPKIASILTENGVDTFKKLSEASVSVLEEILLKAGPRYKMHKPNSWPKQALLAYEDKWEELKTLQDKLHRGK